jgi:predicted lysophospholipase L1 biosynthesis ABC-type transport system permease subunit
MGAFGLLLSIAGTFGLASYAVSGRLRELSLRVALGAQARQILSTALGRMLTLLGIGSVAGIALGVAASRLLSAVVYQASAQDPLVLGAVMFTMALTGLLSVAGPVKRALHIDPAELLREFPRDRRFRRPLPCHLRNINHLQTLLRRTKDLAREKLDAGGRHGATFGRLDSARTPGLHTKTVKLLAPTRAVVGLL